MSLERVCRYRSLNELAISMAGRLAQRLTELQASKPLVHMALTGGTTVQPIYAALGNLAQATALDPSGWSCGGAANATCRPQTCDATPPKP